MTTSSQAEYRMLIGRLQVVRHFITSVELPPSKSSVQYTNYRSPQITVRSYEDGNGNKILLLAQAINVCRFGASGEFVFLWAGNKDSELITNVQEQVETFAKEEQLEDQTLDKERWLEGQWIEDPWSRDHWVTDKWEDGLYWEVTIPLQTTEEEP
jgi:hypothetical protein